ncbi:transketolase [Balneicella halophila]|uniref:transketolase n=2 Tax=Balneicella halophila TaxID=1537566 RepID=A0A7L4UMV3_BALHA|nr:transketolase [Balneicella halophila]
MDNTLTNRAADNIRALAVQMVERAKSGHPGGAMGGADFINILYSEFLSFDPSDPTWINRDRFFLDPGHMSPMLYAQLALVGHFSMNELARFRQWGSPTPGHPEVDFSRGIENTSGPLGQGHTMAVGAAIAEQFLVTRFGEWMSHKIYTYISDGGIQEEIAQGAGRIAGTLGLKNLIMFYDANNVQLSTKVDRVSKEDVAKKYEAWHWNVIEIDGNDPNEIRRALKEANEEQNRPTLIIGNTVMAKGGVTADGSSLEGAVATHGQPLTAAGGDLEKTLKGFGVEDIDELTIFPDVAKYYAGLMQTKKAKAAKKKEEQDKWEKDNPALAAKLRRFFSSDIKSIAFDEIEQKMDIATRGASSTVLGELAGKVENMIVGSADLSNSDKTDGFLKQTTAFNHHDFSGSFLQPGVSEFTLAAICNGMALHGGVIAACGTFFVFSDYMKPAVRLSALMELPVKYIWTHDAFRVGEDGPTHQPIEHEAQIRLLEKLKNHSGEPSVMVVRPCDADETTVAWKMAMENKKTPTCLILSRQNIPSIPVDDRYNQALGAQKGAYIIDEDENAEMVLLASGSEVSTLWDAKQILNEKGVNVSLVSVPSEGIFRNQDKEYQERILPKDKFRFGLTAGLPVTLEGLVGDNGAVFGLNHFGYSAPAKVLDEKFGFTAEQVAAEIMKYVKR